MSIPKTNSFNKYDCWTVGKFFLRNAEKHIMFIDCDNNKISCFKKIINFLHDFDKKNISYVFNIKTFKTNQGYHILSFFPYSEDLEFCYNYILNMICDNPDLRNNNLKYKKLDRIRNNPKWCHCCNPTVIISPKPILFYEYYPTPYYKKQLDLENKNNFKTAFTYFTQNLTHKKVI